MNSCVYFKYTKQVQCMEKFQVTKNKDMQAKFSSVHWNTDKNDGTPNKIQYYEPSGLHCNGLACQVHAVPLS